MQIGPFHIFLIVALGTAVIGSLALAKRALGTSPTPTPAPATPPPTTHQNQHSEVHEEVTIPENAPVVIEDQPTDCAESNVGEFQDIGRTHKILIDAEAADEEPDNATSMYIVSAVGQTHVGRKRKCNEDAYLVLNESHLFIVADGMGGYAGGDVASKLACSTIEEAFREGSFEGAPGNVPLFGAQLSAAIQMGNQAIYKKAQSNTELARMGTTLVAARFSPKRQRIYIGHVGDSRCYRYRHGELTQLTTDHTVGSMGITGPNAQQLIRALGIAPSTEVDILIAHPRPGDTYLLCSDGLSKMLPDDGIAEVLKISASPKVAVETLVGRANDRGGKDNITVILIQIKALDEDEETETDIDQSKPSAPENRSTT